MSYQDAVVSRSSSLLSLRGPGAWLAAGACLAAFLLSLALAVTVVDRGEQRRAS